MSSSQTLLSSELSFELAIEVSFVDGNTRQAVALDPVNGVVAKDRKVFNGSSRSRIEVERISSGGRAIDLVV